MHYVITRGTRNRIVRSRYVRSIASRSDGSIAAIGYGSLSEAQIFSEEQPARQLVAQLALHPVFSLDALAVEPLASSFRPAEGA